MDERDMTAGEMADIAKAAAPGSIRVGGFIVTHVGEFEYEGGKGWSDGVR